MTTEKQKEKYKKLYVKERRTKEQRKYIYQFLRMSGMSWQKAKAMQDWTTSHILQYIKTNTKHNGKEHYIE